MSTIGRGGGAGGGGGGIDEAAVLALLDDQGYAQDSDVTTAISALVGGASSAYDTLGELATALAAKADVETTEAPTVVGIAHGLTFQGSPGVATPAGAAGGDYVVVIATGYQGAGVISTTVGTAPTQIVSDTHTGGTFSSGVKVAVKKITEAEKGASYASGSIGGAQDATTVIVLRGQDPTSPLDINATLTKGTSVGAQVPPTGTATVDNERVIEFIAGTIQKTITKSHASGDISQNIVTNYVSIAVGHYEQDAGTSTPGTFTIASDGSGTPTWLMGTLSFKPAPAGVIPIGNVTALQSTLDGKMVAAEFEWPGTIDTAAGTKRWYNRSGRTLEIVTSDVVAVTAPTGSALTFDVNKGGTTIYGTQGNRPSLAAAAVAAQAGANSVTTLADGEYLTCDCDAVGSSVHGADAVVRVWLR